MTAQSVDRGPAGGDADDTIRRTIDAVIKGRGWTRDDVANGIGMARSSFHRKLAARGANNEFSAGEVASIAEFLGVTVAQLYNGLDGTFATIPNPDNGDDPISSRLARLTEAKRARARGGVTRAYPEAA